MAQEKKKGLSTGIKVGLGCCGGLIVLIIIVAVVAGSGSKSSNSNTKKPNATASTTATPKTETKTEESKPTIDLSFKAIDAIFGIQSDVTDLQKKEQWPQYKGQKIRWTCSVVSVSETFLGSGYTLSAKCNPSTFTSDTRIEFGKNWKDKLLSFKEKDTVTFFGSLDSYGMLGYTIKNGEIK